MVSFTLTAGIALLASVTSAAVVPLGFPHPEPKHPQLQTRQAQMPSECTDYCSVSAGCVCIRRPTNCKSWKRSVVDTKI